MKNALRDMVGAAAALGLALALGCSPPSSGLARVGSSTISVQEFQEVAGRAAGNYPPPADSAKRQLLDDLVQRSLLLEAARREPWGQESELREFRVRTEDEILSQAVIERLVPRDIPVSEGESRILYQRRSHEARLQVIFTFAENLARAARAELDRGATFENVANRFNPPGALPPGGDLGFVAPGGIPSPLDEYLTTAPLGQILGPVMALDQAWYIARVVERRPRVQEPFEAEQMELTESLKQRKRRVLSLHAFEKLRDEYQLRVEPGAPQLLFARYNHPPDDTTDTQDPTLLLARYRGADGREATYKLRDAIDDLDAGANPPDPSQLPSYEQWIESRVMHKIVLIEARARRLHEEPAIAKRIDERVESHLLNRLYEEAVSGLSQTTPADLAESYQRHASMMSRLVSVRVQHITLPDSSGAMRVLEHARNAPTLRDAILHSSAGIQVREEVVRFPSSNPDWAGIEQGLARMPDGAYGGPVQLSSGWRVVQLIAAERNIPTFENLPPEAQQMVRSEAENRARERRLAFYTDSLRQVIPVSIDLEKLKRVPWPAAGPPPSLPPGMTG